MSAKTASNSVRKSPRNALDRTLVLFLVFLSLLGSAAYRVHTGRQLQRIVRDGVHTQALLKSMEKDTEYDNKIVLEYFYRAAPDARISSATKQWQGFYTLDPDQVAGLRVGGTVEVAYAPENPRRAIPVLAAQRPFQGVGWFTFFALLVLPLLVLSFASRLMAARVRRYLAE